MAQPGAEQALEYFSYLAEKFPVMCASDEFHFMPRAQVAASYYDRLDNLDSDTINEAVDRFKKFQKIFERRAKQAQDLEQHIDWTLLAANVAGALIELEKSKGWKHNPLFYLKIAFIGLDHALTKPCASEPERIHRVRSRLDQIPRLLDQAMDNLDWAPESFHQAALSMTADCRSYLNGLKPEILNQLHIPEETLINTLNSLGKYKTFLTNMSRLPDSGYVADTLKATIKDHFLLDRDLDEIFHLAQDDWHKNFERLKQLQKKINPAGSGLDTYHSYLPARAEQGGTIDLYSAEAERLRGFFTKIGFDQQAMKTPFEIVDTPVYLKSVRSSASFGAAFSDDEREVSYFYITASRAGYKNRETENLLRKRLHREFRFLTAHETIPGHHFLDSMRRKLKNPVRRQIESPLFYEGWSYYGETLLQENGYLDSELDRMVDYKRRLWRAARCQVDVGMRARFIEHDQAVDILIRSGFSAEESLRQIDRFGLNPGYQLCYCIGRYEIAALRKKYALKISADVFHELMLSGGELPFHLIDKRFKNLIKTGTLQT